MGIPIVKGTDYGLDKLIKGNVPSFEKVKKILPKIKGALGEEIIKIREEE